VLYGALPAAYLADLCGGLFSVGSRPVRVSFDESPASLRQRGAVLFRRASVRASSAQGRIRSVDYGAQRCSLRPVFSCDAALLLEGGRERSAPRIVARGGGHFLCAVFAFQSDGDDAAGRACRSGRLSVAPPRLRQVVRAEDATRLVGKDPLRYSCGHFRCTGVRRTAGRGRAADVG